MGKSHAASGAVVFLGLDLFLGHSLLALAPGTVIGIGAALLPDIDEPGSSVAHSFGFVTEIVAVVTRKVFGGHRHGTHSLVGVGIVGIVAFLCSLSPIAVGVLTFFFGTVVYRTLTRHLGPWWPQFILRLGISVLASVTVGPLVLVAAIMSGVVVHIMGDYLTVGGVPLLWPAPHFYSTPLLGHTDSFREHVVHIVLLLASAFLLVALIHGSYLPSQLSQLDQSLLRVQLGIRSVLR